MNDSTAKVKYVGPYDAIEVPSLGINVRRDEAIELPVADAAALARQEVWQAVGGSKETVEREQARAEHTTQETIAPGG